MFSAAHLAVNLQ